MGVNIEAERAGARLEMFSETKAGSGKGSAMPISSGMPCQGELKLNPKVTSELQFRWSILIL